MLVIEDLIECNITNCARCGGDHKKLVAAKMERPVDSYTHWVACPKNGDPILVKCTKRRNLVRKHNLPEDFREELPKVYEEFGPSMLRDMYGLSEENRKTLATEYLSIGELVRELIYTQDNSPIRKRIREQFVYCKEIYLSDYAPERKKEIILSAIGTAVNYALGIGTIEAYSILAEEIRNANIKGYGI